MTERSEYQDGTPSWVDIGTDIEGAKNFYGPLFGWTPEDAGPPEETGGYGFFLKNGRMIAGYGPQQSPGPPFWAIYVATSDADDITARIQEAGGTVVVPPMDVMDAGRMAVFQDANGAFISAWQAGNHKGAQLQGEAGALSWVELNARDTERAKTFYTEVFGWTEETHEGAMPYTEFSNGGESVAGLMATPPMVPVEVPDYWYPYFGAEDVDATAQRAAELGGEVLMPGTDIPGGGRFAVLKDPQGAVFGLYKVS